MWGNSDDLPFQEHGWLYTVSSVTLKESKMLRNRKGNAPLSHFECTPDYLLSLLETLIYTGDTI